MCILISKVDKKKMNYFHVKQFMKTNREKKMKELCGSFFFLLCKFLSGV